MKLLVVGSGGREHAVIRKLKENPKAEKIYCAPGNGGISADAECVPVKATDIEGMVSFAKGQGVDFVVVTPDDPLVLGMVDALHAAGIRTFGPDKAAAQIEGSKVFSKNLMKKYGIPTAAYEVFSDPKAAIAYIEQRGEYPVVIKADGLALGKGVIIAQNQTEAVDALHSIMEDRVFGASGSQVVVEEFLTGPEVSVLAFCDGETVVPMVSSMDHKRALDGDQGLNTGGMGTVAPNIHYTPEIAQTCMDRIFRPTLNAMKAEGRPFSGCLYFGLMRTPKGPYDPRKRGVSGEIRNRQADLRLGCGRASPRCDGLSRRYQAGWRFLSDRRRQSAGCDLYRAGRGTGGQGGLCCRREYLL